MSKALAFHLGNPAEGFLGHRFCAAVFFACVLQLAAGQSPSGSDVLVRNQPLNQWFEGAAAKVTISDDGEWALFTGADSPVWLFSLKTGREEPGILRAGLDQVESAAFCGRRGLLRFGQRGGEKGWFTSNVESRELASLPASAMIACSPDGGTIAFYDSNDPDRGLSIGPPGGYKIFQIGGKITAMTFSPDGNTLYAQVFRAAGDSAIVRIMVNSLASRTIATGLDASPLAGTLAISPDSKNLYVALVGAAPPDNEARHNPNADRWLKIFEFDVATGARHPVVESAGEDNTDAFVLGKNLYWARNLIHQAIALVPSGGGAARELVVGGQVPMWAPEAKSVAYSYGGWRLADWALDLDAAEVDVDPEGRRGSQPIIIVSGYHEDFPPAWSPDGNWIAFHSHRSSKPVPEYSSPGSTDDIYLRRAGDVHAPEIRLTDFGWEAGPAYWSPDGQKLMFTSWQRGGQPGIDKLWVLAMDLELGRALRAEMLPLAPAIRSVSWAAWSPDGKEIAIEDNRGGQDRSIWIVRSDGSHAVKLLDYKGTTYDGIDWLPDGKTLIYSALAGERLQLFSMPRAGGDPSQLTHDSGNLLHPRVSPDAKWIACTRLVQSKQIWRRPLP